MSKSSGSSRAPGSAPSLATPPVARLRPQAATYNTPALLQLLSTTPTHAPARRTSASAASSPSPRYTPTTCRSHVARTVLPRASRSLIHIQFHHHLAHLPPRPSSGRSLWAPISASQSSTRATICPIVLSASSSRKYRKLISVVSAHMSPFLAPYHPRRLSSLTILFRYARKDKRPLDPPPVVICSFFEIITDENGRTHEQELDPEKISLGAICFVDLFPVPNELVPYQGMSQTPGLAQAQTYSAPPAVVLPPSQPGSAAPHLPSVATINLPISGPAYPLPPMQYPTQSMHTHPSYAPVLPPLVGGSLAPAWNPHAYPIHPGEADSFAQDAGPSHQDASKQPLTSDPHNPDIVGWFGSFPILESSKCTTMLSGATFMQAAVLDYKGKKEMMFVFSDLAVKTEGTFVLRYRALDLYSQRTSPPRIPVVAECYGGAFRIYSTKEFPGLRASTELTKQLALYGVRVNIRENERKRRKTGTRRGAAGGSSGESDSALTMPPAAQHMRGDGGGGTSNSSSSPTTHHSSSTAVGTGMSVMSLAATTGYSHSNAGPGPRSRGGALTQPSRPAWLPHAAAVSSSHTPKRRLGRGRRPLADEYSLHVSSSEPED
ncbi:velvet factor-domain-containing protein [Trametes elegans]|nr:velvet factor-domain-containing protein [Trametes elegans]